jgi:hypothetical protein
MSNHKNRGFKPVTYTLVHELMASPTQPMPQNLRTHQLNRMYSGLRSMETAPTPNTDDWRVVSDSVNLMETLVLNMKICEDASGLLLDAVTALALAGRRHMQGHNIRLDAPGIQAVRAVLEDYAQLLDILPHRVMVRCHRLTERRIQGIQAGHRQQHDVEVVAI